MTLAEDWDEFERNILKGPNEEAVREMRRAFYCGAGFFARAEPTEHAQLIQELQDFWEAEFPKIYAEYRQGIVKIFQDYAKKFRNPEVHAIVNEFTAQWGGDRVETCQEIIERHTIRDTPGENGLAGWRN